VEIKKKAKSHYNKIQWRQLSRSGMSGKKSHCKEGIAYWDDKHERYAKMYFEDAVAFDGRLQKQYEKVQAANALVHAVKAELEGGDTDGQKRVEAAEKASHHASKKLLIMQSVFDHGLGH